MAEALLLLLGAEAGALAPRLEASGYRTIAQAPGEHPETATIPDAVLISASEVGQIPQLRQQFGNVPLLLDGEQDTVEARCVCLSTGADDFWLSCLGPSDLLMRLRLHLNLSQQVNIPIQLLQVGDLVVNPSARQVKRAKRQLELTAREYQLLMLLMERKGTVVSRGQILRLIWPDQQGASSNVIEVYVRYLRQKLEEGGERRLIHTVRGQGYCLSERIPHLE